MRSMGMLKSDDTETQKMRPSFFVLVHHRRYPGAPAAKMIFVYFISMWLRFETRNRILVGLY